MSRCVAEDSPLVVYGSAWHLQRKIDCVGCGTPFCRSCFAECPRCGFPIGMLMEVQQPEEG